VIVVPAMAEGQEAAWHGLLDLYEVRPDGWTLIGGQLVHLHCAERGYAPPRPTDDADTVVDARAAHVLGAVTAALAELEFIAAGVSADGIQHRWTREKAVIDVLIPDGMGERAEQQTSASGFPTLAAPGGTQALSRTEVVEVQVGNRRGKVPRPNLIGAMILKAKARIDTVGPGRERHCDDFAILTAMLAAVDLRGLELTKGERRSLRTMVGLTRQNHRAVGIHPDVGSRLARLERFLG
jgi:hypothetical protein